ncbi:MAG: DNA-processing protein DprA [Neisseria sp.]|nr:DNA-processing protein DprA [Neisseria sp.]
MTDGQERHYRLRLALMPHIGAETFQQLIDRFGTAEAAWRADDGAVRQILTRKAAQDSWATRRSEAEEAAEAAEKWSEQENCRLLLSGDDDFPAMLTEGITPPPLLFVRGNAELLHRPSVAVVGSRHATPQALRIARDFGKSLSEHGIPVVSGMAAGIDTAAHRGALAAGGGTIAFWGTGIDRVYPSSNRQLAHELDKKGAIVSEFPLGTPPAAGNFPRRNRLIAALSQAVLVVEAALESGSLITARLAGEMGREVLAVPGSIDNPHSKGCHKLIKEGAKLTEALEDILQECPHLLPESTASSYSIYKQKPPAAYGGEPPTAPAQTEEGLIKHIGYSPVHPDILAERLDIPAADLYAALLELELDGKITALSGGRYQRI